MDCDADGEKDHVCIGNYTHDSGYIPYLANSGGKDEIDPFHLVLSAEGCPGDWGTPYRNPKKCIKAFQKGMNCFFYTIQEIQIIVR